MQVGGTRIELVQGDIARETVDAIVNAANSSLLGGGGVDGAIHRAGGPRILEECRAIAEASGPLPAGEAVITSGGRLGARFVVHTVGPIWRGGDRDEPTLLRSCYERSLEVAAAAGAKSIAFPAVSTGAYGFPIERAAPIALGAALSRANGPGDFDLIRFVLFSAEDLRVYESALEGME